MTTHKPILIFSAAVALFGALYLTWLMLTPFPVPFDSHRWQTCTYHSDRFAMHRDLFSRNHLIGMDRAELFQLLGDPDGSKDAQELNWDMGSIPSYDDNALRIKIKDGKAVSFSIFQM